MGKKKDKLAKKAKEKKDKDILLVDSEVLSDESSASSEFPAFPEEQKKKGRPSSIDRSKPYKVTSVRFYEEQYLYSVIRAGELKKEGLCSNTVSGFLAYLISKDMEEHPDVVERAKSIYKLQTEE